MRESRVAWNGCGPICTANTMASRCLSITGKRPATTTSGISRSKPMDENGLIGKVERSIPDLISCDRSMNGATCSSRTQSGCDRIGNLHQHDGHGTGQRSNGAYEQAKYPCKSIERQRRTIFFVIHARKIISRIDVPRPAEE